MMIVLTFSIRGFAVSYLFEVRDGGKLAEKL
jgi:hypothetical protein